MLSPCYTEEIYELALGHGDFTSTSVNDLHIATLLEIAPVSFRLMVMDIHTVSSFVSSFWA